jgi:hypothetical protein
VLYRILGCDQRNNTDDKGAQLDMIFARVADRASHSLGRIDTAKAGASGHSAGGLWPATATGHAARIIAPAAFDNSGLRVAALRSLAPRSESPTRSRRAAATQAAVPTAFAVTPPGRTGKLPRRAGRVRPELPPYRPRLPERVREPRVGRVLGGGRPRGGRSAARAPRQRIAGYDRDLLPASGCATSHAIYFLLHAAQFARPPVWSAQQCGVDTSRSETVDAGSVPSESCVDFVISGNDGAREGSWGRG